MSTIIFEIRKIFLGKAENDGDLPSAADRPGRADGGTGEACLAPTK
jgi:hypothetical protein